MEFENPFDFAVFFYSHFIQPLIDLLCNTELMGYSVLSWFLGLSVLALAVVFFRRFLGFDDSSKG